MFSYVQVCTWSVFHLLNLLAGYMSSWGQNIILVGKWIHRKCHWTANWTNNTKETQISKTFLVSGQHIWRVVEGDSVFSVFIKIAATALAKIVVPCFATTCGKIMSTLLKKRLTLRRKVGALPLSSPTRSLCQLTGASWSSGFTVRTASSFLTPPCLTLKISSNNRPSTTNSPSAPTLTRRTRSTCDILPSSQTNLCTTGCWNAVLLGWMKPHEDALRCLSCKPAVDQTCGIIRARTRSSALSY